MLCTDYYGCCRLFQTTIKNYKVPHFKSIDLNRIQVTIPSLAATYNVRATRVVHYAGYCHQ